MTRRIDPRNPVRGRRPRTKPGCIIQDCDGEHVALDLCGTHYARLRRHGDPLRDALTPAERFWPKVDVVADGCWLWTASVDHNGYGKFHDGERDVKAHRFAYELLIGPIPEGLELDHLCRVRACVRPLHLDPVTREENVRRSFAARVEV